MTSAPVILCVISGILFGVSLAKPLTWPLVPVAGFLLAVAFFVYLYNGK
jgi:hypothetical protein